MVSTGPRIPELLALVLLALLACSQPAPKSPASKAPEQRIRDWKMSSQGPQGWTLSAQSAQQRNQRWQLSGLHWHSPASRIEVLSPQARQTLPETFQLQPLEIKAPQVRALAPQAELNLHSRRLQGKQIRLEAPGWRLEAKGFSAAFPLQRWQLQQVHARFQTCR